MEPQVVDSRRNGRWQLCEVTVAVTAALICNNEIGFEGHEYMEEKSFMTRHVVQFLVGKRTIHMSSTMMLTLRTGAQMPALGFGTWQATAEELESALECALETGYRHIDTAHVYQTESVVGKVLSQWINMGKVKREELFIVTKLPPTGNRPESVERYLMRSLEKLQLDYVDMYLIHLPFGFEEHGEEIQPLNEDGSIKMDPGTDHVAIWKAMEAQVDAGRTRAIGISNFNKKQIQRIIQVARIPPANFQVELHVYCQQHELVNFCKRHDIVVCAYSPLGSRGSTFLGKKLPDLLSNPTVIEIAERLEKTPAQILLRHILQHGLAVIPKSTNPERIRQNFQVQDFELSADDVAALDKLDQGASGRIMDFLFVKGITKHPEYPF